MAQQTIITTPANTGTGDAPKSAFDKINAMFTELFGNGIGGITFGSVVVGAPSGGNEGPGSLNAVTLFVNGAAVPVTQSAIGTLLYPVLGTEVGVINAYIPYYNILRYGTNLNPGVTDMTTALTNAIASAQIQASTDGKNYEVFVPAGSYGLSAQIVVPYGVSVKGQGNRSTRFVCLNTFAALTATGLFRIGLGTSVTFGTTLSEFMIELNSIAGSIGIYSSDIQNCGVRNVLVNNFLAYGIRVVGTGGSLGSANGYSLEKIECFKSNSGGAGGFGISVEQGTFPAFLYLCQVVSNPANPLTADYQAINFPLIMTACNADGGANSATSGVLIGAGCPFALISGFTSNGPTTTVQINTVGRVTLSAIYKAAGTNTIVDAGNSGVAKTITDTVCPFYERGATSPAIFENANFYSQVDIAGGVATTINFDKAGALGTTRGQLFVGDGTASTVADDVYIAGLNTPVHIKATEFYPPTPTGAAQSNSGIFGGTGVPSNVNGTNGDIYFNAAGAALTTVYQKRAGAWVGIV